MRERNLKENLILKNGEYYSEGNLVLENGEYYLKGDLFISGGTLIMANANLVVEGDLKVFPSLNEDGSIASPISDATIVMVVFMPNLFLFWQILLLKMGIFVLLVI